MNTIYSAAAGYTPTDLTPFLVSAQRHLRDLQAVLLITPEDEPVLRPLTARFPFVRFALLNRGSRASRLWCWLRYVGLQQSRFLPRRDRHTLATSTWRGIECGMNPALSRYFLIERELAAQPDDPTARVMLCDSRDIVFQGDAFAELDAPFSTGAEPTTVGPRDRWIGLVYGAAGQARLAGKQVYCSGFSIGSLTEIRAYVRRMCDEMWAHLPAMLFHRGLDQAIHIHLLHEGLQRARIYQNAEVKIATISLEKADNLRADPATGAVRVFERIPCVLHQYDRHAALTTFVRQQNLA